MSFIREILTRWSFQVDDKPLEKVSSGLDRVGKKIRTAFTRGPIDRMTGATISQEQALKNLGEAASGLGKNITQLGIAFAGIAASVGGLFLLAKQVAGVGDEIAKTSQALGVGAEALQKLRYAGDLSGVSLQQMDTSLKFLSKNMQEFATKGTGEAADAFKSLGIQVKAADGTLRTAEDVILQSADALSKMPDGAAKTATAMKLFGKEGARLIPFLNEGSKGIGALMKEAEDLGIVMSGESLKASEEFLDSITRLEAVFNGIKNIVGAVLIPIFNDFVVGIREGIMANKDLVRVQVRQWAEGIARTLKQVWSIARLGFNVIDRLAKSFGGWEKVIKIVSLGLALLGGAKVLALIGGIAKAVWTLSMAFRAMGIQAAIAQVIAFAIPIAIGAAVAAIGLLIEDVITFFEGGESATGKFIDYIVSHLGDIKNAFVSIGGTILEFMITPLRFTAELLNNISKFAFGFDFLKELGVKTGKDGEAQRKNLLGSAFDLVGNPLTDLSKRPRGAAFDLGNTSIAPSPLAKATGPLGGSGAVSIKQDVTINANGLSEEAAKAVISQELGKSQKSLLQKAGNVSLRKNLE